MPQNQFRLRMPDPVREGIEQAAQRSGHSINSEIVQRLAQSLNQERILGGPQMAGQMFAMIAAFAHETHGKGWINDPLAYAAGATAVIGTLIRSVPQGPNRRLAVQGIISSLLTLLANDPDARPQEQPKRSEEAA